MLWEELEEKRGILEGERGGNFVNLLVMGKDRGKQHYKQTLKAVIT